MPRKELSRDICVFFLPRKQIKWLRAEAERRATLPSRLLAELLEPIIAKEEAK